jgi:hypothetical protein
LAKSESTSIQNHREPVFGLSITPNNAELAFRRIANVVGAIDEKGQLGKSNGDRAPLVGPVSHWIDRIVSSYQDLGVDTFVFWPSIDGQENEQARIFAEQVVPKVRTLLGEGHN